jgi:hypothetical protein
MSTLKVNTLDTYTGTVLTVAAGKTLAGDGSGLTNIPFSAITDNAETVQDVIGAMVETNTENGIAVTYADSTGKLNFDVGDFSITLSGDISGVGTVTNLANVSFTTEIGANKVGNAELVNTADVTFNSVTADLTGDVTGNITGDVTGDGSFDELKAKPSGSSGYITARLDAWLDNVTVTSMSYTGGGDLDWVTYATGHKANMVYTGDDLTGVKYYDTNGTTHIHTLGLTYTGADLTSTTWTDI